MNDDFIRTYNLLKEKKVENALHETLHIFNLVSNGLIAQLDISSIEENGCSLEHIAEKRQNGVPLEYIIGSACFYGQRLICEPGALIPRSETELLTNIAIEKINQIRHEETLRIIDMGTGCGNIAVTIALNTENTLVYGSDLKAETVAIAKKNVAKFQLEDRITLLNGDLFAPFDGLGFEGQIDIIVCNPPYIPSTSLKNMPSEIIDHEPEEAFDGGAFGIGFYRRLIKEALSFLKPDGLLLFEIGIGQEKLVSRLFNSIEGYHKTEFFDDGEKIRVICAQKFKSANETSQ